MRDFAFKCVYSLDRVTSSHHHKICRVIVNRNAGGIQIIYKFTQDLRGFGAGFNSKACAEAFGKNPEFAAGIQQNRVAPGLIGGYNADMRCNYISFKLESKLGYPL